MSASVRFPIARRYSGVPVTAMDLNVMVEFFTSKELEDLRSESHIELFVETETVGMTTSTLDLERFFSSQITVRVMPLKEPRTLLTGTRGIWKST
jgi:hypothetical protein